MLTLKNSRGFSVMLSFICHYHRSGWASWSWIWKVHQLLQILSRGLTQRFGTRQVQWLLKPKRFRIDQLDVLQSHKMAEMRNYTQIHLDIFSKSAGMMGATKSSIVYRWNSSLYCWERWAGPAIVLWLSSYSTCLKVVSIQPRFLPFALHRCR